VTALATAQRTREIAVRMALGAPRRGVLRMVMGQGLSLVLVGFGLGLAGALAVSRLMRNLLYGVDPVDPLTFVAVSLVLLAVAALACFAPARRAASIDPLVALRVD
jgi:ABC-type antimicrobial peptide transport system permease subunit